MKAVVGAIDWDAPWLAPYAAAGRRVSVRCAAGTSVADALAAEATAAAPRFVAAAALPPGEAYECFVARTGCVPTRDHLHDLLNGLVWLAEPVLKRAIARRHAEAIAADGVGPRRGPLRDRLTLIDDNGALLAAPPSLADALRRRDWQALFVAQRAAWRDARITLVGHGLLERLAVPRAAITAHVLLLAPGGSALDALEGPEPLRPLPVLGVPGWWEPNEAAAFYRDARAFRPAPA